MKIEVKKWISSDAQVTLGTLSMYETLGLVNSLYGSGATLVEVGVPERGEIYITIPQECGVEAMVSLANWSPDEVGIPLKLQDVTTTDTVVTAWWD